jgi:SAM-dependent methyltransferase
MSEKRDRNKDRLRAELQGSYDRVVDEYVKRFFDELEKKPIDRELLDRFAESVRSSGPVCDLGCGPGQIGRYLHDRRVEVFGLDLSPAMVKMARRLNPNMEFKTGNMLSLDIADGALGGIAAFYSIIHIEREDVVRALGEMKRVLKSGGRLLISFHVGQDTMHVDELWGETVSMDITFFSREEMEGYLGSAGFEIEESVERPPYQEVEYESQRAYIFAKKP